MLDKDRVKTEQMLKTIGEERMRLTYIELVGLNFIPLAGELDGY